MSHSLLNSLLPVPHQTKLSIPSHSKSKTPNSYLKGFGFRYSPIPVGSNNSRSSNKIIVCEKMEDDGFYIRKCVELAKKAIGRTAPNPMVGCVIVKGDEIVGQGFHPKAGQPHAEVFALRDAGILAENATAYVSLEPCNHYGRTPPCTEALIRAKVKRVVVGMVDPNPIVASKGVERLRASGIDVTVGIEELLCQKLIEAYTHRMLTGKPFVTLRYSMSFNGRILNHLGGGAEESGGYYSKLLEEYDGIVSSSNFYTRTSNLPASHETGANQPLQIVITKGDSLHIPDSISKSSARIVVLAEKPIIVEPESEGVEVVVIEQMNLRKILDYCGQQGLCSVILDIREDDGYIGDLLEDGLNENLVQKVVMELCPVLDRNQESSLLTFGKKSLSLKDLQSRVSNDSVIVEGYIS